MLLVALLISALAYGGGGADGLPSRYSAATPATCGVAIEVPLMVLVAVSGQPGRGDARAGGEQVQQVPKFENDERASVSVVEPMVRPAGTRGATVAGAVFYSLPAASA